MNNDERRSNPHDLDAALDHYEHYGVTITMFTRNGARRWGTDYSNINAFDLDDARNAFGHFLRMNGRGAMLVEVRCNGDSMTDLLDNPSIVELVRAVNLMGDIL